MKPKYDDIGIGYDTTRQADPEIIEMFESLLGLEDGKQYLDVACGTGNYTAALSSTAGRWSAVDISATMLAEARSKSDAVNWFQSNIEELNFDSNHFDGAICSLAIHHFHNLNAAFLEVGRVLINNANFVLFTATPEQMNGYWLTHYFPEMMEKACHQMPTYEQIDAAFQNGGLSIKSTHSFYITPALQDFFLYSGKQRPEIYLSESVRQGISSFHDFCTEAELETGLTKLQQDIDSGAILTVMDNYENELGDYLFIQATKNN